MGKGSRFQGKCGRTVCQSFRGMAYVTVVFKTERVKKKGMFELALAVLLKKSKIKGWGTKTNKKKGGKNMLTFRP